MYWRFPLYSLHKESTDVVQALQSAKFLFVKSCNCINDVTKIQVYEMNWKQNTLSLPLGMNSECTVRLDEHSIIRIQR